MAQNFLSGTSPTAIDTQRVLEVKILNRLNGVGGGAGGGGSGSPGATGVGSPEGVVSASPGTTYYDTTTPGAAGVWFKRTGTGNTGWEQYIV